MLFRSDEGQFAVYEGEEEVKTAIVSYKLSQENTDKKVYEINISQRDKNAEDLFIKIRYAGDCAKLYINGEYVDDHFYTGRAWEIGMKRFGFPKVLKVEIMPLDENAQIFLEEWPAMEEDSICELISVEATTEYKAVIA